MIRRNSLSLAAIVAAAVLLSSASAFVQPFTTSPSSITFSARSSAGPSSLSALPPAAAAADIFTDSASSVTMPSTTLSASTIDPTSMVSSVLGGLLGSPAIILVPVLAAVAVASLVAWFIVASANPADEDE